MLNSGIFDKKLKVGPETSEAYNEFSNIHIFSSWVLLT